MKKVTIIGKDGFSLINFRRKVLIELSSVSDEVVVICRRDEYIDEFLNEYPQLRFRELHMISKHTVINLFYHMLMQWCFLIIERPKYIFSFTIVPNLISCIFKGVFMNCHVAINITGIGRFELHGRISFLYKIISRYIFKRANVIFVQNKVHYDFFCNFSANVVQLPGSGVDLKRYRYRKPKKHAKLNVLMSSRVIGNKGLEVFIEAAKISVELGEAFQFYFCLGYAVDYESVLYGMLKNAENSGFLHLVEFTRNFEEVLFDMDVVVLPSSYGEGIPRSLIEAQAVGNYVIASGLKQIRQLICDTENGCVLEETTPMAIIEALKTYQSYSLMHRSQLANNGRLKIEKLYSEDIVVQEYKRIFEEEKCRP